MAYLLKPGKWENEAKRRIYSAPGVLHKSFHTAELVLGFDRLNINKGD